MPEFITELTVTLKLPVLDHLSASIMAKRLAHTIRMQSGVSGVHIHMVEQVPEDPEPIESVGLLSNYLSNCDPGDEIEAA